MFIVFAAAAAGVWAAAKSLVEGEGESGDTSVSSMRRRLLLVVVVLLPKKFKSELCFDMVRTVCLQLAARVS